MLGIVSTVASVGAAPAPVVLITVARHPLVITIRELQKDTALLFTRPRNYTAHLGPHSKVDVERACVPGPGVLLLLGLRVGGLQCPRLTLYW